MSTQITQPPRHRLNIFIQPEHAKRLNELAVKKGTSKSSIIAVAIASWLSPDAGEQREAAIAKRLDRLARQFDKLDRDQTILIETLALYVRYYLTVSTPLPEAHQEAAKAQGKARFEQFVEQLGRHLLRGRSLVRDVYEEIAPGQDTFLRAGVADGTDHDKTIQTSSPTEGTVS